jgi:uncharacterized delta-60 repeat protein
MLSKRCTWLGFLLSILFLSIGFASASWGALVQPDYNFVWPAQFRFGWGANPMVVDVKLQPDGKILIAGDKYDNGITHIWLYRVHQNWMLDTWFRVTWLTSIESVQRMDLLPDGKIYAVWMITHWWVRAIRPFRLLSNWALDTSFYIYPGGFNNNIRWIWVQPDGKLVVIWNHTQFNGVADGKIIRFNTNGTIDTWFAVGVWFTAWDGPTSVAFQTIWWQNKVLVWGRRLAGTYKWYNYTKWLIRLHDDASVDMSFDQERARDVNEWVAQMHVLPDQKVILWWQYCNLKWYNQSCLARIHPDGKVDTWFNARSLTLQSRGIQDIEVMSNGDIVVVGDFAWPWGSQHRPTQGIRHIARMSADWATNTWFNYTAIFNTPAMGIEIQPDDKIIAVGNFTTANGEVRLQVARLHPNGTLDSFAEQANGVDGPVSVITRDASNNSLLVWGAFYSYMKNNVWVLNRGYMRLSDDGIADTFYGTNQWWFDVPTIYAILKLQDGRVLVWWKFTRFRGVTANNIVMFRADGSMDTGFVMWTWFNDEVNWLTQQPDGKILVWWRFTTYQWVTRNRLVRLNLDGSIDGTFNIWAWFNSNVYVTTVLGDWGILVWWLFSTYDGQTRNKLVKLLPNWWLDNTFDRTAECAGFKWIPTILYASDAEIYIPCNSTASFVTRINSNGQVFTGFVTRRFNHNGWVLAMARQENGGILIWWNFNVYSGNSLWGIARLLPNWDLDTTFNKWWSWFNGTVNTMVLDKSALSVWGNFTTYNGEPFAHLVRLEILDTEDLLTYTAPDNSFTFKYPKTFRYKDITWRGKLVTMFTPVSQGTRVNVWTSVFYVTKWNTSDSSEALYAKTTAQMRKIFRGWMSIKSEFSRTENGNLARIVKYRWRIAWVQKEYTIAILRDPTSVYVISANADISKSTELENMVDIAIRTWTFN